MTDLTIMRMADALARHSAARHELIARNIANADTPGYRAIDYGSFTEQVGDDHSLRATRAGHLHGRGDVMRFDAEHSAAVDAAGPNGNDVSLPDQIARATQAMGAHDRALTIYRKSMDILRLGLGRK
jgi:flagellar basal-body rod protein FlgB